MLVRLPPARQRAPQPRAQDPRSAVGLPPRGRRRPAGEVRRAADPGRGERELTPALRVQPGAAPVARTRSGSPASVAWAVRPRAAVGALARIRLVRSRFRRPRGRRVAHSREREPPARGANAAVAATVAEDLGDDGGGASPSPTATAVPTRLRTIARRNPVPSMTIADDGLRRAATTTSARSSPRTVFRCAPGREKPTKSWLPSARDERLLHRCRVEGARTQPGEGARIREGPCVRARAPAAAARRRGRRTGATSRWRARGRRAAPAAPRGRGSREEAPGSGHSAAQVGRSLPRWRSSPLAPGHAPPRRSWRRPPSRRPSRTPGGLPAAPPAPWEGQPAAGIL